MNGREPAPHLPGSTSSTLPLRGACSTLSPSLLRPPPARIMFHAIASGSGSRPPVPCAPPSSCPFQQGEKSKHPKKVKHDPKNLIPTYSFERHRQSKAKEVGHLPDLSTLCLPRGAGLPGNPRLPSAMPGLTERVPADPVHEGGPAHLTPVDIKTVPCPA